MDIDARGRLYVASWRGGESAVYVGPNVGFVARVTPRDLVSEPFPDLKFVGFEAPSAFLVGYGLDHAEDFRHLPFIADLM